MLISHLGISFSLLLPLHGMLYGEGYESPPRWQGGRYTATLVKENGQWHIRSIALIEALKDGN